MPEASFLAEFALLKHFSPLRCPQVVFNHVLAVLAVNHSAFINKNLGLVPFAVRLLVLGLSRNHVVERCRHAVSVHTQLGIGMICIVKHLIFRSRDIDRLESLGAILVL